MELENRYKMMRVVALGASLMTAFQAIISLATGSSICPNAGCKFVESLTVISPFYLNIAGLIFFQIVFWLSVFRKSDADLMGLVLLAGLAFDSALLGYQIFVAHSLCSYCLLVLLFVIILNEYN